MIGKKEYNLNSNNKDLLEVLPTKRYNPVTRQKDIEVWYLPVTTVIELLNWLFDGWSFNEESLTMGKTYMTKWFKDGKAVDNEVETRMLKCSLKVYVPSVDRVIEHTAIREWVCSTNISTNDDSLNGFDSKLSARVLKSLCKRLGKVFRVGNEDEADEVDKKDTINSIDTEIVSATAVGDKPSKAEAKSDNQDLEDEKLNAEIQVLFDEWMKKFGDKFTRSDLLVVCKEIKTKKKLKTEWKAYEYLKALLDLNLAIAESNAKKVEPIVVD